MTREELRKILDGQSLGFVINEANLNIANAIENATLEKAALLLDANANDAIDTYGSAYLVVAAKEIREMKK